MKSYTGGNTETDNTEGKLSNEHVFMLEVDGRAYHGDVGQSELRDEQVHDIQAEESVPL